MVAQTLKLPDLLLELLVGEREVLTLGILEEEEHRPKSNGSSRMSSARGQAMNS